MPAVVSINIAKPARINLNGGTLFSGILKKPVTGRIQLQTEGFLGDGTADKRHHGGSDKGLCVYPMDHFPYWEKELGKMIPPGAFGENLTVSGLDENLVHIGDIFRVGNAKIQISQPRQPCHKVSKLFGLNNMACQIQKSGFTGFYCRVLQPGWIEAGDNLALIHTHEKRFTVGMANHLMYVDKKNKESIKKLLSLDALSVEWKRFFTARLQKLEAVA
ncbi:MAG: MOSC domain-containing protein [Nitrospinota bacterium]|nr:MOSC domain-containing protein [Nitrospinota bacterium]